MTDSPDRRRDESTQAFGGRHPGYTGYPDPAYASQTPYGPPYQPPVPPRPTQQLPAYGAHGYDPYATSPYPPQYPPGHGAGPPPEEPKPPRWLWIVAGIAVLAIIGLVIALMIVNSSSRSTVMTPMSDLTDTSATAPSRTAPPTTSPTPRTPILPLPTSPTTTPPNRSTVPGASDAVVYNVAGTGRVINITYVDTGGMLQTEFNVMLPWSREVSLPRPGEGSASVSIINVGREVTCSITVNGAQVQQRTGAGLTICAARN